MDEWMNESGFYSKIFLEYSIFDLWNPDEKSTCITK
jgi:hypothetical protein